MTLRPTGLLKPRRKRPVPFADCKGTDYPLRHGRPHRPCKPMQRLRGRAASDMQHLPPSTLNGPGEITAVSRVQCGPRLPREHNVSVVAAGFRSVQSSSAPAPQGSPASHMRGVRRAVQRSTRGMPNGGSAAALRPAQRERSRRSRCSEGWGPRMIVPPLSTGSHGSAATSELACNN